MSTRLDIPVIDAHHHLWRRTHLAWLDGPPVPRIFGEYESIRRDYLADEYLQVFPSQMGDAADLASAFPDLQIVLLHAGMLTDRNPATLAQWRAGMQALSGCPNVSTKLSALSTFARRCSAEIWQPIVHDTLAWFGPARCMFGSDFPVEKLWTDYQRLFQVFRKCIDHLSIDDQRAVLHDTAARTYRLG